jgi:DNA-binding IclR family transcriptional regulator
MVKREKSRYVVQSVMHTLDILESFSDQEDELSVTELCNRLELHKKNVSRLLTTLENRGYIEQNKITGNFRLGLKIFEMGQVFFHKMGLLKQARPVLEDLVNKCNETAYVGVLRGEEIVYLDTVETSQSVRIISRVGWRVPAYCTAIGKAQIAFLPENEIKDLLKRTELKSFTKNTITDAEKIMEHLKMVASQGYAVDEGEYETDIKCVGVPVRDYSLRVVAGITISGPSSRMGEEKIKPELIELVKEAGTEISRRMGYDIGLSHPEEES